MCCLEERSNVLRKYFLSLAAKLVELKPVHITTLSSISASMCQRHVSNYAANTKHPEAQVDVQLAELDAFGLKCPFFF